jgi:hypothetical protein
MARIPIRRRLLEDAIVPMCQSPKIVNVLIHARGGELPTNDNCALAETSVKAFQARGPFAAVWQAFLGLCVRVLQLFEGRHRDGLLPRQISLLTLQGQVINAR